jgi:peptide/nickel transport system ATP-binding protein
MLAGGAGGMSAALYQLAHVRKAFPLARTPLGRLFDRRAFVAVDDVDLAVAPGEILGIVGESGSGKTTLARLMVALFPPSAGRVEYRGRDLTTLDDAGKRAFRNQVQMVFQSTHAALNPRKSVRTTLAQAQAQPDQAGLAALMELVQLDPALLDRLPHELSGGQRQRVGIARAIARAPETIIADEPTSSLDVSLQGEIIELLRTLHRERGLTLIVISHDLAMIGELCTRVIVMHRGAVVEQGAADAVLARPGHAYTRRLIDAIPRGLAARNTREPSARLSHEPA